MFPMELPDTLDDTLLALRNSLAQMARWGCRGFDCSEQTVRTLAAWDRPPVGVQTETQERLEDIRDDLGDCRRCALAGGRTHLVFGEGDPRAELVFVGEGPGFEEDRGGRPFVGPAGQLLTRIIEAMHLSREQVYICNVVKCRPPENRNPLPEEIGACRPFLERQLSAIRPKAICVLGAVAAHTLLETEAPISHLRGRFHDYHGIKVMPTFHPSYLLRNPEQKRVVWEDVKKIMALLRIPL
ncbi:MAG: uracil-DNA glycosylase [Desulfobacterales bacterium]|nr:uracil-DNA glycosylase [Desulfobacterales bacterium]